MTHAAFCRHAEHMAPEQASGSGPVGPATDIYAGVMLYQPHGRAVPRRYTLEPLRA